MNDPFILPEKRCDYGDIKVFWVGAEKTFHAYHCQAGSSHFIGSSTIFADAMQLGFEWASRWNNKVQFDINGVNIRCF